MSNLLSLSNVQIVSSCRSESMHYFACFLILKREGVLVPLVAPVVFIRSSVFCSIWTIRSGAAGHRKFLGEYCIEFDKWFSENFRAICRQFLESLDTCKFGIKAVATRYVAQDLCFRSIEENLELFSEVYAVLAQKGKMKNPAMKRI